jgi:hypothetical protein
VLQQFVPKEALDPDFRSRKPFPKSYLQRLVDRLGEELPCRLREF